MMFLSCFGVKSSSFRSKRHKILPKNPSNVRHLPKITFISSLKIKYIPCILTNLNENLERENLEKYTENHENMQVLNKP